MVGSMFSSGFSRFSGFQSNLPHPSPPRFFGRPFGTRDWGRSSAKPGDRWLATGTRGIGIPMDGSPGKVRTTSDLGRRGCSKWAAFAQASVIIIAPRRSRQPNPRIRTIPVLSFERQRSALAAGTSPVMAARSTMARLLVIGIFRCQCLCSTIFSNPSTFNDNYCLQSQHLRKWKRGQGTISDFDSGGRQLSLNHASTGPHRV